MSMMAQPNNVHSLTSHASTTLTTSLNEDDPNDTPYNSFSSFKYIDNTVVSAYEVGIKNGVSAHARSSLASKNGQSVKRADFPVPRERKSLARKPPSGAKLEYKLLGSKSKSLSEIHTINNRGNKILDSNVKRFDNRPLSHNKNTTEGFKSSVNNEGACSVISYQNEGFNKTVISVDNNNGENLDAADQIASWDDIIGTNDNETELSDEILCEKEKKNDKLSTFLKHSEINGNKISFNRRHSLQDGIGLQSSNLIKDDSSEIHRHRLVHGDKGKRYSRRKHLSLQTPPTQTDVHEKCDSAVTDDRAPNLIGREPGLLHSGNNVISSRRKLPKVPAKIELITKNMSEEGNFIQCDMDDSGDSVPEQAGESNFTTDRLSSHPLESDHVSSSVSDNPGIASKQSENPSQGTVETNYLKSQQRQLKTRIVSKMADFELNSSGDKFISKSLPSQDICNPTQGIEERNCEREVKALNDKQVNEKRRDRVKSKTGNVSNNVEDKFRKKLKEFVAQGSHKKAKDLKCGNINNISETENISADKNEHESLVESALRVNAEESDPNFPSLAKNSAKTGSNRGKYDNTVSVNDIGSEGVLLVHSREHEIPVCDRTESTSNAAFNFNQEVIQEITDGLIGRSESRPDSQITDYSDIQESFSESKENSSSIALSTASEISVRTDIDRSVGHNSIDRQDESVESNFNDSKDRPPERDFIDSRDKDSITAENQYQKLELEGRSYKGKVQGDENNDTKTSAKIKNTADTKLEKHDEHQKKQTPQKQTHVLRTPSYRKRVMARAKLRYGKKSQNFKECSCVRRDNSDLEKCDFCKNFELKQRSKTSLGHIPLGEYSDSECSEIASPRRALTPELTGRHAQDSPRSVRKVNVSPRVDLLMSSNLFKKHLLKHENLIHKHTMSYKRFGMQKSVSNLDLSEGFTADDESSLKDNASEISEPAQINDLIDDSSDHSLRLIEAFQDSSSETTNRRHSLTGESTLTISDYDHKAVMRKKSGDTLPSSFAKPRSRPGIGGLFDNAKSKNQNRNYIPSFHEFKRQKEKDTNTTSDKLVHSMDKSDSVDDVSSNSLADSDNMSSVETIVDHNLQTVLETDERGSRENLLNSCVIEDITQKDNKINPEVIVTPALSSQNENKLDKPRPRLKGKSRTLPNIDLSVMSDNSSDKSSDQSVREKRRINAKRPRSVISKKSSMDSDTPDTSDKDQGAIQTVSARPKLKGHGKRIIRSESDTKYETEKARPDDIEEMKSKGVHSRHLSLLDKGHNSVSFNLDAPINDGASERSSSVTGSYQSDSIYSESCVNETVRSTSEDGDFINSSTNELLSTSKDDLATSVLRSTSDACEITQEAARKRRERKERPYKSDPFSGTEIIPATKRCAIREEKARLREHLSFASSSREEILSFLDGVSQSDLEHGESFPSLEELSEEEHKNRIEDHRGKLGKHPSNVSSLSTDSGVIGQEESHDSKQSSPSNTLTHSMSEQRADWFKSGHVVKKSFSASCGDLYNIKSHGCQDCRNDGFSHNQTIFICSHCEQRRIERKKIIQEVIETELNYGRDLKILQEEFYKPMLKAGLLSKDQLDCIFLNLDELIHVNVHFITKLKAAINHSNQHDDEDLQEVMIGSLFLESSTMFLTFENYCVNQAQAPILLEQLEREKELLRIFLHVSQSDNQLLRRMHLKSFLMVPVQRIMKYPLLLDRLYKVTLDRHRDKEALREAKEKIEDILGHINAKSKSSSIKQRKGSEKHYSVTEKIEVSRVALETLGWNRKDVCDVITTRLQITQPLDHMWAVKKCKNHKFTTVHGVLLSLLQPNYMGRENDQVTGSAISNASINNNNNNYNNNNNKKNMVNNNFTNSLNNGTHIQSAAVVLIKEKNGRYQVAREPFMLEKCVVSQDPDYMDVFELLEWNRESYLIKAETPSETKTWVQHLRRQMQDLGYWRKRRNALPNILLNHLS